MKKDWGVFWIFFAAALAAFAVGAVISSGLPAVFRALLTVVEAVVSAVWFLHFRSISYKSENGSLIIQSGFFIGTTRVIRTENILWKGFLKIGGRTLLTAVHTAGGTAVLFCEFDPEKAGEKVE